MTASPTPYNSCLPSVSSCPEQKTRYPAAENSVFPDLLVSCRPMKSHPSRRAFPNTHSACHTRSSLLQPGCAHCRSLPPQVPPSVSLGPRVLQPLPADAWSDPSVFFVIFFSYSPFYRDIGSLFPSPVHALISDGWVQPSSPPHPRHSRPRCRGVGLPTLCPASPLSTLYP